MALITKVMRVRKAQPKVHGATRCEASCFDVDGKRYVQLDTFGSTTRQKREQISQSLQLDQEAATQLRLILDDAFPLRNR